MRVMIPAFLIVFTPAVVGAQQGSAHASGAASAHAAAPAVTIDATGDAAADARIERAATRVDAAGLSSASLASRVEMGRARGVSAERIAAAVESRAEAMLAARDALRASAAADANALVELGADAIESGAHASQVAVVAAEFQGSERARAIAVLSTLAAQGTIGDDVAATVRGALDAGATTTADRAAAGAGSVSAAAGASATTTGVAGAAVTTGASATGTLRGALPR